MKPKILVVDEDQSVVEMITQTLSDEGFQTERAYDGQEAFDLCKNEVFDIVISDLMMPNVDGLELLRLLKGESFTASVIILTGHSSVDSAMEAMKMGAVDYIQKPVAQSVLLQLINKELKVRSLRHKVAILNYQIREKYRLEAIIGKSRKMHEVFEKILKVAETDSTVLIQGETGTGKELVAAAIHAQSSRKNAGLVIVNVGGLPETLLESELFGHEKGAFTGALYQKRGRFELAHNGTIFLDEIGDLSSLMQVKLLRILQERSFERVGGTKTINLDIRFIAATNKNLLKEVETGAFRSDLYYRLNIFPVNIPPLRERKEDIPLLANHFVKELQSVTHKSIKGISSKAIDNMMKYSWPGNVRELENVIERAMITAKGDMLTDVDVPDLTNKALDMKFDLLKHGDTSSKTLPDFMDECEKFYLSNLLSHTRGAIGKTASAAGIDNNTLYKKMKRYGLQKDDFKYRPAS